MIALIPYPTQKEYQKFFNIRYKIVINSNLFHAFHGFDSPFFDFFVHAELNHRNFEQRIEKLSYSIVQLYPYIKCSELA